MEIRILRNCKLINCKQIYDKEELYETDTFNINLIKHYEKEKSETIGFIILGRGFGGKQIEIYKTDFVCVKDIQSYEM